VQTLDELAARRPRRSKAWGWYTLLAAGALVAAFTQPVFLLATAAFGVYARYLYRGGAVVVWFW
jgi:hypothetical protein